MVRRGAFLTLVCVASLLSGCITATDPTHEGGEGVPAEPVLKEDTRTMTASVDGPQALEKETTVAGGWALAAPATIESVEAVLRWTEPLNEFHLRVDHPGGTERVSPDGDQVVFSADAPTAGTYTFNVVAEAGMVLDDQVTLQLDYSWMELPGETLDEETPSGPIAFTQEGDRWRATIVYVAEREVTGALEVDLDTLNGDLKLSREAGKPARVEMTTWALAATKERAGELVQALNVQMRLGDGEMVSKADAQGVAKDNDESLGGSIDARVPASISGRIDTSNGAIHLDDVKTSGLDADTSNGKLHGKITSSGDLSLDTSNGKIELTLIPTKSLTLNADTSNGDVTLSLKESASIGYKLEADTSNGEITEAMDEASLSGEKATEKVLETSDYGSRSIKVSGMVDSSNGDIHFKSA